MNLRINLQRNAARLGVLALVVLAAFMFLQLTRKAQAVYASQRNAGALAAGETESSPPPSAAWRQVLFFDRGAAPAAALVEGWSSPDPGAGVSSNAHRATLLLPPSPYPGAVDVALTVEPFIAPARPFQRVTARIGAQTLGEWRLTKAETLHVRVPAELRGPAGDLQLQLDLPDAESPAALVKGAMDPRRLAIALKRITITG
jgi:hypothetical protein